MNCSRFQGLEQQQGAMQGSKVEHAGLAFVALVMVPCGYALGGLPVGYMAWYNNRAAINSPHL